MGVSGDISRDRFSRRPPPEHMGTALLTSTERQCELHTSSLVTSGSSVTSAGSSSRRSREDAGGSLPPWRAEVDLETRIANSAILGGCVGYCARRLDARTAVLLRHACSRFQNAAVGTPVGSTPEGNYVGVYWQYGRAHPLAAQHLQCSLSIDGTSGRARGHGTDDVGAFGVDGAFRGARLALTKRYVAGTGNPRENRGHAVELRLMCCALDAALPERATELQRWGMPVGSIGFFGTWHVRTAHYRGDAEMVLWLPPSAVPVGFVIELTNEPIMMGMPPNQTCAPHPPPQTAMPIATSIATGLPACGAAQQSVAMAAAVACEPPGPVPMATVVVPCEPSGHVPMATAVVPCAP